MGVGVCMYVRMGENAPLLLPTNQSYHTISKSVSHIGDVFVLCTLNFASTDS